MASEQLKPILILDVGNVLFTVNMDYLYDELVELGLFRDKHVAYQYSKQIEHLQNIGAIDYLNAIVNHNVFNNHKKKIVNVIYNEAVKLWMSDECMKPNKVILDYVYKLLQDDRIGGVAIASNMGFDHKDKVIRSHSLFSHDKVLCHFSCDVGAVKPQYLYWHTLSERIKKKFVNVYNNSFVYVDDRYDFLQGANSFINENNLKNCTLLIYNSSMHSQEKFCDLIETNL